MSNASNPTELESPVTAHSAFLYRFVWAMFGPIALLGLLVTSGKRPEWFTFWEIVYVLVVALMILSRYGEQRSGTGTTLYSEPSTWSDFRRYSLWLTLTSTGLWVGTKLLAPYLGA
jgi:hypothetical protein